MRLDGCATPEAIADPFDTPNLPFRALGDERAAVTVALGQMRGDVAKLRRKILVDEQDVHGQLRSATACG